MNPNENLKRLSELDSYKIEPGDPDPRGWSVITTDGQRVGRVSDLIIDTAAMKVRHLVVDLDRATNSGGVLIDAHDVELRESRREVLAHRFDSGDYTTAAGQTGGFGAHGSDRDSYAGTDRTTLTRSEEELEIDKREVSRGEAVIAKHVETEHVTQPVTRRREEVVVERRPVGAEARADARIADDEIRVPLMEEAVIVEKRPVVKEELVVGKRVVEERDTVEADVRREEFDIDENVTSRDTTRRRDR